MWFDWFIRQTIPALIFFGISVALLGAAQIVAALGWVYGWW